MADLHDLARERLSNKDRFAKLMALTTSDRDGEALTAIRKANAILKAAGLTWPELLTALSPAPDQGSSVEPFDDPDQIEILLDIAFATNPSARSQEFLRGIEAFFRERGFLTARQFEALARTAGRREDRGGAAA